MRRRAKALPATGLSTHVGLALAAFAVGLLMLLAAAGTARAASDYEPGGEFASGAFTRPTAIAVDDVTGDVLVVDSGSDRVQVFAGGSAGTLLTEFGSGELSSPYGIAVDQSNGDVYVSDAGNNRVVRYATDRATPPTYTFDNSYAGPSFLIGSFASPIAIDPTDGDLLVADSAEHRVTRWSSSGEFKGLFEGQGTPGGAFTSLWDIAVGAAGEVYVATGGTFEFDILLGPEVRSFGSTGQELGSFGEGRSVAVGPDETIVIGAGGGANGFKLGSPATLRVFHGDALVSTNRFPGNEDATPLGLAIDSGSLRAYGLTGVGSEAFGTGAVAVQLFDPVPLPDLVLAQPTVVSPTTVHLTGSVDPLGVPTSSSFEYSSDGGKSWTATDPQDIGAGAGPVAVQADIPGLAAPDYLFRLAATNANGTIHSSARPIRLLFAETLQANQVGPSEARLRAKLFPSGNPTSYRFEFGTTTAYGQTTATLYAGAQTATLVSRVVSGLSAGTTYHYRVVATNSTGTVAGADRTFATPVASLPRRVYEQVSPAQKNGVEVKVPTTFTPGRGTPVGPGADSVVYTSNGSFGDSPTSYFYTFYRALRSADGWRSQSLDVPQHNETELRFGGTIAVSEDLTHSVVTSRRALTPGAVEGAYNTYLRDTDTGAIELIFATQQRPGFWTTGDGGEGGYDVLAGTPSFDHVVFGSKQALTADAPDNGLGKVYEFSGGELQLISLLPDGQPATESAYLDPRNLGNQNVISADGSRIFFGLGADSAFYGQGGVYMYEGGHTVPLSTSHRSGDGPGQRQAIFVGASRDGSVVFFTSLEPLTEDAHEYPGANGFQPGDLYRYDIGTDSLVDLTPTSSAPFQEDPGGVELDPQGERMLAIGDDGNEVYFKAYARLTEDAIYGDRNIYSWRDGQLHLVNTGPLALELPSGVGMRLSPDGRFAAFLSWGVPPSGYDNRNAAACPPDEGRAENRCRLVYLYDSVDDELTCVSCDPAGGRPLGDSNMGVGPSNAVMNDGTVFFNTRTGLVPSDRNGGMDAYEWHDGELALISAGDSNNDSQFVSAGRDGRDVFFVTDQRLVGQDRDNLADLYDARRGGGIAGQNPLQAPVGCEGEGCQASLAGGPIARAVAGSLSAQTARQTPHRRARRCPHRSASKKRGARRASARPKHAMNRGCGKRRSSK